MSDSTPVSGSQRRGGTARLVGPVDDVVLEEPRPASCKTPDRLVGPVEAPVYVRHEEPPAPPNSDPPGKRSNRTEVALWAVVIAPLAVLLAVVLVRETVGFYVSLRVIHPVAGYAALAALALIVVGLLCLALRSLRRYRQLERISELQELHEHVHCFDQCDGSRFAVPRLDAIGRRQIMAYLQRLDRGTDEEVRRAIHELRLKYGTYGNDLPRDFGLLEEYVLRKVDADADKLAQRIALEVAIGTALAPRFLDAPIVIWKSVVLVERIARIYAGRPGALGTLKLLRNGLAAALFAGVLESLSGSLLEGSVEALTQTIARRASEGVVNGLLIMRLAEAVKRQCRPVPPKPVGTGELLRLVKDLVFGHRKTAGASA